MRPSRAKLLTESAERVSTLVSGIGPDARRALFRMRDQPGPLVKDAEAQRIVNALAAAIDHALARYVQLHRIIEDAEKSRVMAGRFPWHGTTISKSDHFYFVWFNFTNQCYLFRERAKLFLNDMNALRRLCQHAEGDVGTTLRKIDKALGEYIRHRGSHVHEWHNDHLTYSTFSMIEHLVQSGDASYADRYKDHYQDTKFDMKWRIERAERAMCELFLSLDRAPHEQLASYVSALDKYLKSKGAEYPEAPARKRSARRG